MDTDGDAPLHLPVRTDGLSQMQLGLRFGLVGLSVLAAGIAILLLPESAPRIATILISAAAVAACLLAFILPLPGLRAELTLDAESVHFTSPFDRQTLAWARIETMVRQTELRLTTRASPDAGVSERFELSGPQGRIDFILDGSRRHGDALAARLAEGSGLDWLPVNHFARVAHRDPALRAETRVAAEAYSQALERQGYRPLDGGIASSDGEEDGERESPRPSHLQRAGWSGERGEDQEPDTR